jgi:hypothetical protein
MTSRAFASWSASFEGPLPVEPNHSMFHSPTSNVPASPRGGIETSAPKKLSVTA